MPDFTHIYIRLFVSKMDAEFFWCGDWQSTMSFFSNTDMNYSCLTEEETCQAVKQEDSISLTVIFKNHEMLFFMYFLYTILRPNLNLKNIFIREISWNETLNKYVWFNHKAKEKCPKIDIQNIYFSVNIDLPKKSILQHVIQKRTSYI